MIALDTNVLVRILVNDPAEQEQNQLARHLAKTAKTVFISQIVQVETVWVLESAYHFDKAKIVTVLQALLGKQSWVLQHSERFALAVEKFSTSNAGFADCLILAESQHENLTLWTFDRKLGKLEGAQHLTPTSLHQLSSH